MNISSVRNLSETSTDLLDSSSAIILYKAELHTLLVKTYKILLSRSVYNEISLYSYSGSEEYKRYLSAQKIQVVEEPARQKRYNMPGLDSGEYDTIQLYLAGMGDFIITDDGPAARYCKKKGIPFINALVFPVVLRFAGSKDDVFCTRSMARIIEAGRYSQKIITFAKECSRDDIEFALP